MPIAVVRESGQDWAYTETLRCENCEREIPVGVEVGAPSEMESRTTILCLACAKAAVAALEGAGE